MKEREREAVDSGTQTIPEVKGGNGMKESRIYRMITEMILAAALYSVLITAHRGESFAEAGNEIEPPVRTTAVEQSGSEENDIYSKSGTKNGEAVEKEGEEDKTRTNNPVVENNDAAVGSEENVEAAPSFITGSGISAEVCDGYTLIRENGIVTEIVYEQSGS